MSGPLPFEVELGVSPCCHRVLEDWTDHGGYPLRRCGRCGSAYVDPRPSLETLKEHYTAGGHGRRTASTIREVVEAEERYPNSIIDARRILSVLSNESPGCRLLDVGSGYGFYALEARRREFEVHALELSSFERRCTRQIAGIEPKPVAFEDYCAEPGSYDAILMSQILEHVVQPEAWIQKAHRLLVREGVLAVALPNFDSIVRRVVGIRDPLISPPDHLNHFNGNGLCRLLSRNGFSVFKLESISRFPGTALTDRVPVPDVLRRGVESLVQIVQRPLLWPLDALGLGMFLNVYGIKDSRL